MSGRVPMMASLIVLRKGGELENWILEQPLKVKGLNKHPVSPKGVLLKAKNSLQKK